MYIVYYRTTKKVLYSSRRADKHYSMYCTFWHALSPPLHPEQLTELGLFVCEFFQNATSERTLGFHFPLCMQGKMLILVKTTLHILFDYFV